MIAASEPILVGTFLVNRRKIVGKGQFFRVYQCSSPTDSKLCCKVIPKKFGSVDPTKDAHCNLVTVLDVLEKDGNQFIITERCDQDLREWKRNKPLFQWPEVANILLQIVNGLLALKAQNQSLLDLKPSRILLTRNTVKLNSHYLTTVYQHLSNAQRSYASPEIFFAQQHTSQKDVFSLGLILYQLIYGRLPHNNYSRGEQLRFYEELKVKQLTLEENPSLPELLLRMLCYDPNSRITLEELQAHPLLHIRKGLRVMSVRVEKVYQAEDDELVEQETQFY